MQNNEFCDDCTFVPATNKRRFESTGGGRSSSAFSRRSRSEAGFTRSMVLYENHFRLEDRKRKLVEDEQIRHLYEQKDPKRRNQKSEMIL